jgi:membrane protein involved in colicin uptake
MAAKKLAEEKAKEELEERARKEKEEKVAQALADRLKAEQEAALKKQKEMEALQAKLKNAASAAEAKRLEDLAKQEELFRNRQSKFAPVMGVYSNTSTIINGKKAYGYINFGNGVGNQDLTKEEYEEYNLRFKKEYGEKK